MPDDAGADGAQETKTQAIQVPRKRRKSKGQEIRDDTFVRVFAAGDPEKGIKPGNAKASYKAANPTVTDGSAEVLGSRKLSDVSVQARIQALRDKVADYADDAIEYLGKLPKNKKAPHSVRSGAAQYVADQALGKAAQRVEHVGVMATFTMDLSGGKAGKVPQSVLDALKK